MTFRKPRNGHWTEQQKRFNTVHARKSSSREQINECVEIFLVMKQWERWDFDLHGKVVL
jgi:hypothetical protein